MSSNPLIDPILLTQELVRLNTINPPGNEDIACDLLEKILLEAGFECERVSFAPKRTSLIARIVGSDKTRLPICFTGHMDVVPLGTREWVQEPFNATIIDGKLYGRGSSDMKSGLAAFVVAAIKMASITKQGSGIRLIITAGEETGCEGAFHLVAQKSVLDFIGPVGCLVVAEPTANEPLIGHKGALWLRAHAEGVTAHGSMPERGDNAFYKLARGALALEQFAFDNAPQALMGQGTLNVGTAKAGLNINSVPDSAEMTIDIRTVAGQNHRHIYGCICKQLGPAIKVETIIDLAPLYTPVDHPWVKNVFQVCTEINGQKPIAKIVSYFSDASALKSPIGDPPTVILGPGEPEMAHQTDEFCYIKKITDGTRLFEKLIANWCSI